MVRNHYEDLLHKIMQTMEPIYLYGTDLTGYPSHVDCGMVETFNGPDLMHSMVTLRIVVEDEQHYAKFRKFRYYRSWKEEDHSHNFVLSGGGTGIIQAPQYPMYVEAVIPLKFISDVPFDGMPSGRLLYGKEDDT